MKQVIAQKTLARLLCVAVLSPIWMSGVFAAKTTVAQATPVPFSVPGVVLAETTVASLPPAPSVVALSRLTLAPTAVFADLSVPGPQLIAVESGSLMVTMTGDEDEAEEIEGRVHRGGTPVAQGLATPTAGSFVFTLVPGDSIFVPGDTPHTFRNVANEPAIFLAAAVTPQPGEHVDSTWPPGTTDKLPEGVSIEMLDVGYDAAISTRAPSKFILQRVSSNSNEIMPRHQAGGPELFVVENGALEVDVVSGAVEQRVKTAGPSESIQADESAATPTAVQSGEGGAVLLQPGTIAVVRSASGPITMLVLTVLPV